MAFPPESPQKRRVAALVALIALLIALALPNAFYWTAGGETWLSFKVLFAPALIGTDVLLRRLPRERRLSRLERLLAVPVFSLFLVLIATGPILLVNAWTGEGHAEVQEGTVLEKRVGGRGRASVVFVDGAGVRRRWPVHRRVISAVEVGDRFRVNAVRGGLGITYVLPEVTYWKAGPQAR